MLDAVDPDTFLFLAFGLAVTIGTLIIPWRYWVDLRKKGKIEVFGRIASLAIGFMFLGFGILRGYGLHRAATTCRELWAHVDFFHRRDVAGMKPVGPLPRFGLGRSPQRLGDEEITCARFQAP